MLAEPGLSTVLAVAACRESHLLDYTNHRSRFAFNFGDGAAGVLLTRTGGVAELLASDMITDGSLSHTRSGSPLGAVWSRRASRRSGSAGICWMWPIPPA